MPIVSWHVSIYQHEMTIVSGHVDIYYPNALIQLWWNVLNLWWDDRNGAGMDITVIIVMIINSIIWEGNNIIYSLLHGLWPQQHQIAKNGWPNTSQPSLSRQQWRHTTIINSFRQVNWNSTVVHPLYFGQLLNR